MSPSHKHVNINTSTSHGVGPADLMKDRGNQQRQSGSLVVTQGRLSSERHLNGQVPKLIELVYLSAAPGNALSPFGVGV